jgi:hypothetical protein
LILTPEFEDTEECKNVVSLAYSFNKVCKLIQCFLTKKYFIAFTFEQKIVPTIWKPLHDGFPPESLEFCLKSHNYFDFSKTQISAENIKFNIKIESIFIMFFFFLFVFLHRPDIINWLGVIDSSVERQISSGGANKNFLIKGI